MAKHTRRGSQKWTYWCADKFSVELSKSKTVAQILKYCKMKNAEIEINDRNRGWYIGMKRIAWWGVTIEIRPRCRNNAVKKAKCVFCLVGHFKVWTLSWFILFGEGYLIAGKVFLPLAIVEHVTGWLPKGDYSCWIASVCVYRHLAPCNSIRCARPKSLTVWRTLKHPARNSGLQTQGVRTCVLRTPPDKTSLSLSTFSWPTIFFLLAIHRRSHSFIHHFDRLRGTAQCQRRRDTRWIWRMVIHLKFIHKQTLLEHSETHFSGILAHISQFINLIRPVGYAELTPEKAHTDLMGTGICTLPTVPRQSKCNAVNFRLVYLLTRMGKRLTVPFADSCQELGPHPSESHLFATGA